MRPAALAFLLSTAAAVAAADTCDDLVNRSGGVMTVASAQRVDAGAFAASPSPAGRGGNAAPPDAAIYRRLPAFCRVSVVLKPSPRSTINSEIWLPASSWNGRLQVVGNGGFAGAVAQTYGAMARALADGYAAAGTDTGHVGGAANAAVNDDVILDFAHRAIHETTAAARRLVDGFYGRPPQFSYFNGCSTGGRQALTAAQRYPADFDGIIAGDPAIYGIAQTFGQVWLYQAVNRAPGSALPEATRSALHRAVLDACDAADGAVDGVLENPTACRFDPAVLGCRGEAADSSCLTPAQLQAVRDTYAGAVDRRTGRQIHPGLERGSELQWSAQPGGYAIDFLRHFVFKDAAWNPATLDFARDTPLLDRPEHRVLDADNPDLRPFFALGGKLLMYHGWSDAGIPPRGSVNYYNEVRAVAGSAADRSLRLFMVPGMGHCRGGDGTDTFDMVAALDRWVTSGEAPSTIPASRIRNGVADRTRPLCAYPAQAVYRGRGSLDDAANFECRESGGRR